MLRISVIILATLQLSSATAATSADNPAQSAAPADGTVCKFVVASERGSKPYQMCMTGDQWAAKEKADARDASRLICHYEDAVGSRLGGNKVCLTAGEWADRQRLDRQQTETIQMSTCVPGGGC